MPPATIYKLLTRGEWEAARSQGVYRGSAHDARDGFIHFSTAAQLAETARKHFAGVQDLLLLAVDVEVLKQTPSLCLSPRKLASASLRPNVSASASGCGWERGRLNDPHPLDRRPFSPWGEGQDEGALLRWEPSRGGDLFPHLYACLLVDAVASATAVPLSEDGIPIIPSDLKP